MRAVFCALQFGRMSLGRQQRAVCLERFSSQGLLEKQRKNAEATLMAHVLRIFIRHVGLWWSGQGECGGEGFCLVGACAEHCTCAVIIACSYVVVAVICVFVNLYSGF